MGCNADAPAEAPLFDRIVEVSDVAASGSHVFVANDISSVVGAPPGSVDPDRLHDFLVLAPIGSGYAAEGFFDTPAAEPHAFARRLVVDGARALAFLGYRAPGGASFVEILDLADTTHPVSLHRLEVAQPVLGLGVGGTLLVVCGPEGLDLFDVADPGAPIARGRYAPDDNAGVADAAVDGDRIYAAATAGTIEPIFQVPRLLVLDASDRDHPSLLGERRIESNFQGRGLTVKLQGHVATLLADIGLMLFDVTDPAAIGVVGGVPGVPTVLARLFTDVERVGDVAFLSTRASGVRAVDLSLPSQPFDLTTYPGTSAPGSVVAAIAAGAGRVYVGLSKAGVRAVSVDADGDAVLDVVDDCPAKANPDQADADFDSVGDACDDCIEVSDFDQLDADGDGYGNRCDADLDNDGRVNFADLERLKQVFFTPDAVADLDGDGFVNFADLARMKHAFFGSPGPSAKAP
jgi:hypothetical protein